MTKTKTGKNVDILEGNLFRSILAFGFPLLLVSLLQSLFNAVDIAVLGQMADTDAVASVGATTTIVHLLLNLSLGISAGAKIVLARLVGEREKEKISQAVYTTVVTALAIGAIVLVIGVSLAGVFLKITSCPSGIYGGARTYISIYFAAAPAIMLYNFGSNILQAAGDSKRPLYYMAISGLLNIVLNFVLCLVLPNKVAAVAIATAASQVVGAILVLRRILTLDGDCRFIPKKEKWSSHAFKKLMVNGIPIGLSSSLYSIANLQIQSALNSFGPDAIAGNAAGTNIEGIVSAVSGVPWSATAGVFISQNLGAGKKKRVTRSILLCLAIPITISVVLSVSLLIFARPLLALFVDTDAAIKFGTLRVLYVSFPYFIATYNSILDATIQSFGYSAFCTAKSILCVFVFRMIWMAFVYPLCPTFAVLMQCFLVSWILISLVGTVFTLYLYFAKFKKDKISKMG